jgi:hypothetical protein
MQMVSPLTNLFVTGTASGSPGLYAAGGETPAPSAKAPAPQLE